MTAFLSIRKRRFVQALLSGLSPAEAGAQVGVSERTARRWLGDPLVQASLRELQGEALRQASRLAGQGALEALSTLRELARDRNISPVCG